MSQGFKLLIDLGGGGGIIIKNKKGVMNPMPDFLILFAPLETPRKLHNSLYDLIEG